MHKNADERLFFSHKNSTHRIAVADTDPKVCLRLRHRRARRHHRCHYPYLQPCLFSAIIRPFRDFLTIFAILELLLFGVRECYLHLQNDLANGSAWQHARTTQIDPFILTLQILLPELHQQRILTNRGVDAWRHRSKANFSTIYGISLVTPQYSGSSRA